MLPSTIQHKSISFPINVLHKISKASKTTQTKKIDESSWNWHLEAKILFLVQVNSESQYL
jgi:hypothetical protein